MDWLIEFPELSRGTLRDMRLAVDGAFRDFTRTYGDTIEASFDPIKWMLIWFEDLLTEAPWILVIAATVAIVWFASRRVGITVGAAVALFLIGLLGMWEELMQTMAIVLVCTILAIIIGMPIGILMSRFARFRAAMTPVLDVMQTMPSFVYLIPVVMLFGIGKVPGMIAIIIYAVPPIIRLTDLGIRLVDKDVLEAADAFGASNLQRLYGVQMPLALPTIMAGVNQTIMMSLAMVVVASLVGVEGLGILVLNAITNQFLSQGLLAGGAIVAIAIIFDRASQAYGKRLQKHSEVAHG